MNEAMPSPMSHYAKMNAKWAVSKIQSDLRRRLGRVPRSVNIDTGAALNYVIFHVTNKEDGRASMTCCPTRFCGRITQEAYPGQAKLRTMTKRKRTYQQRLQALVDDNYLYATLRRGANIRLQFLGIRVKDLANGPSSAIGTPHSDMVSREDQLQEL